MKKQILVSLILSLILLVKADQEYRHCKEWRNLSDNCIDTTDTRCFVTEASNNTLISIRNYSNISMNVIIDLQLVTELHIEVEKWSDFVNFMFISSIEEANSLVINFYLSEKESEIWLPTDGACSYADKTKRTRMLFSITQKYTSISYIKCVEYDHCTFHIHERDESKCNNQTFIAYPNEDIFLQNCPLMCNSALGKVKICFKFHHANNSMISKISLLNRHENATKKLKDECFYQQGKNVDFYLNDSNHEVLEIQGNKRDIFINVSSVQSLSLEFSVSLHKINKKIVIGSFRNFSLFLKVFVNSSKQIFSIDEQVFEYKDNRYLSIYRIKSDTRVVELDNSTYCVSLSSCNEMNISACTVEYCEKETNSCLCKGNNLYLQYKKNNTTRKNYFLNSNENFSVILNVFSMNRTKFKRSDLCGNYRKQPLSLYSLSEDDSMNQTWYSNSSLTNSTNNYAKAIYLKIDTVTTVRTRQTYLQYENIDCSFYKTTTIYLNLPETKSNLSTILAIVIPMLFILGLIPFIYHQLITKPKLNIQKRLTELLQNENEEVNENAEAVENEEDEDKSQPQPQPQQRASLRTISFASKNSLRTVGTIEINIKMPEISKT